MLYTESDINPLKHPTQPIKSLLRQGFDVLNTPIENLPFFSKKWNQGPKSRQHLGSFAIFFRQIKPIAIANLSRNVCIFIVILTLAYTCLMISNLPAPQFFDRPAQVYQLQDIQKAGGIFGQKEIDLSKVKLTGIMSGGSAMSGFAVFEVNGKSTSAIAVGETFDQAYFLKSINLDRVEIVYQGKPYQMILSKKNAAPQK